MTFEEASIQNEPELARLLGEEVEGLLKEAATPGAGCALLLDGQPVFVRGVGFKDLERTIPLNTNAQFYIYSLTKSLLAAAVLQRVEQGQIDLDGPVQDYLPGLPLERPVTVRQLLNHTGGIPDYGGLSAYHDAIQEHPAQPWTPAEFLAATLPRGLAFPPGEGWGYSNIGYLLVRLVLQRSTGGSLQTALDRAIFRPLGLRQTFAARDLADAGVLAPGYSAFFSPDGSLQDVSRIYHPGWVSHGVVVSTALETGRIFDALFGEKTGTKKSGTKKSGTKKSLEDPKSFRATSGGREDEVTRDEKYRDEKTLKDPKSFRVTSEAVRVPSEHPLFREPSYGLGLMLDPGSPYGLLAGHGGGGPGYSAGALVLPDVQGRCITAAAIANRDQPDFGLQIVYTVATRLAEALGG